MHSLSAVKVSDSNFDEHAYLDLNMDVRRAVEQGAFASGLAHYQSYGKNEDRYQANSEVYEMRREKNAKIKNVLKRGYNKNFYTNKNKFNFLTEETSKKFNIVDTPNISSHDYDTTGQKLIRDHDLVLDCGAGYRNVYYSNVVNLEIVDYSTTDVVGVGEELPFKDNSFDAVISIAVLEHVKDPFLCAKEIARVLKPGGDLYCAVPFMQPFHGYPHHYFNMTKSGVRNLFDNYLDIGRQEVSESNLPINSLCWFINSWAEGLDGKDKQDFLNMKVSDFHKLLQDTSTEYHKPYVKNLSIEKNFELATGTVLFAKKPVHQTRLANLLEVAGHLHKIYRPFGAAVKPAHARQI